MIMQNNTYLISLLKMREITIRKMSPAPIKTHKNPILESAFSSLRLHLTKQQPTTEEILQCARLITTSRRVRHSDQVPLLQIILSSTWNISIMRESTLQPNKVQLTIQQGQIVVYHSQEVQPSNLRKHKNIVKQTPMCKNMERTLKRGSESKRILWRAIFRTTNI